MSFQSLFLSSVAPSGPERYYYRHYYAKSHKFPCAQSLPEDSNRIHFVERHNFTFDQQPCQGSLRYGNISDIYARDAFL